jgi:hypothetical protein
MTVTARGCLKKRPRKIGDKMMLGNIAGYRMVESVNAIDVNEIVGKKPKYIKRTWKERLFERPFSPFKKYRLIMLPEYKPMMYSVMDTIIYHPSFKDKIYHIANS